MQEHFLSLDKAVVIDTETTGINPQIDRIVSLSALKVDFSALTLTSDGLLQLSYEKFGELVDPEIRIPREATAIHGISDADVVGRRTFRQLAPDFLAFVGDLPLVAHNMKFDGRFLDAELGRCGKPLPTNQLRLCTMMAVHERACAIEGRNVKWPKLRESGQYVGMTTEQSDIHDAFEDALNAMKIAVGLKITYFDKDTGRIWRRS